MTVPVVSKNADARIVIERINRILQGKLNAVTTVTLAASVTSTTLTDSRISAESFIGLTPTTATAAAAMTALRVSAKTSGSATLTHNSTADLDRTYDVLIIG